MAPATPISMAKKIVIAAAAGSSKKGLSSKNPIINKKIKATKIESIAAT